MINIYMSVVNANSKEHFYDLVKNGKCIIDFHGEWCPPCVKLGKELDKIANSIPDVTIIKVNVNDLDDIAEALDVSTIPHIAFYDNGKLLPSSMKGISNYKEIIKTSKEVFKSSKKK
jgi:thioredoxin-like negative regulator of GroEL